jgi:hypothetical protein
MEVAATQSFKTAWQISRRYLGTKDEITIKFFDIYSQSQKIVDAHETKKCKKETQLFERRKATSANLKSRAKAIRTHYKDLQQKN